MFQTEVDKSKNLLTFVFSGHVTPEETRRWLDKLPALVGEVQRGFKLLNDSQAVTSMDPACAPDVELAMELLDKAGIGKVVRIITNPRADIGFNIMSLFHYHHRIPIVTCETMEEAERALAD